MNFHHLIIEVNGRDEHLRSAENDFPALRVALRESEQITESKILLSLLLRLSVKVN